MKTADEFYNEVDRETTYSTCTQKEKHTAYPYLISFIKNYDLSKKKCLEIGSSKGLFQDIVADYSGIDVSENLRKNYHKIYYVVKSGMRYPFEDEYFDAIWSWAVHEHIIDLDQGLIELVRVLKKGGVVLFCPAWQCRSWAAQGYAVRPYSDFNFRGKMIKACIPIRDSAIWRSLTIFPKRFLNHLLFSIGIKPNKIHYKKLNANYDHFWISDSDACNHIDPHDSILWFESHGLKCISHPLHIKSFLVRTGPLIFKKIF